MNKKSLIASLVVLLVMILLSFLLLREEKKSQPLPLETKELNETVDGQLPAIVDLPVRDFSAPDKSVITVIEHPTAERKASFVQKREAWIQEKRERNRQIENQAIQAAQNTAFEGPASTTPGNDTAGITEIPRAKEPTKKEIEEMNARGIIIY